MGIYEPPQVDRNPAVNMLEVKMGLQDVEGEKRRRLRKKREEAVKLARMSNFLNFR